MATSTVPKLAPGALVLNTKVESWGPGKVLFLSGNTATVHFRDLPANAHERRLQVAFLTLAETQSDPALDLVGLPKAGAAGGKGARSGKKGTKAAPRKAAGSLQQAIDSFLAKFPKGFLDPGYFAQERDHKWQAHERWGKELGAGEGERLVAAGSFDELRTRALAVEALTKFLHPVEKIALREALAAEAVARPFFETLLALTEEATPSDERFGAYARAVAALPARGQTNVNRWTAATALPAMARPDTLLFVKPDSARLCAARIGLELNYTPQPNWLTYRSLLELAARLLEELAPHGARDFIDVQSFIWVTRELP